MQPRYELGVSHLEVISVASLDNLSIHISDTWLVGEFNERICQKERSLSNVSLKRIKISTVTNLMN